MDRDKQTAPDSYQQAWQAYSAQTRVTIGVDLLRKEVRREERNFRTVVFWRDFREVACSIVMIPIWIYLGVATSSPWTWYLTIPALLWVAGFMLVYRLRHRREPERADETLLQCVSRSLAETEDQIWLLRNVLWWYLLPFTLSLMTFFVHVAWPFPSQDSWDFLGKVVFLGFLTAFLFGLYYWIYRLNQRYVRMHLEPRRQEFQTLLETLQDETSSDEADGQVVLSELPFAERSRTPRVSPAQVVVGVLALAVVMAIVTGSAMIMVNLDPYRITGEGFPKRSPFAAVRWQEYQPEVKLDEEWFKLESLEGIPTAEMVAFSRRTYGDLWRKRFEEDLVELLTAMKHPPQDEVTLVVQSLTSSETFVREAVPMTYANRQAVRDEAESRATPDPQPARSDRTSVSIEDTEQFRQRVDEFLYLAQVKTGFSGVVLVAQGGEPVYQGAVGFSHLASRIPNSPDTPFRVASLSRQFTAAAIMSLEAEGKLSVDDFVYSYLPDFDQEPYRGITIHHLLTHTSGLPLMPEDETRLARWNAMSMSPTPVDEFVRLACQCPLQFDPGQGFEFSNFGHRILSAIIVRVTGKEYADFMEERLFEPLGLANSGVARLSQPPEEAKIAEVVSLLALNPRSSEPSFVATDDGHNYGTGYGDAGIYASANDLLKWDRIMAGEALLSAEQKARLFRPVNEYYMCGWIFKTSASDGRLYQSHLGANAGYFCKMMRVPEDDLVIIALGNVFKTEEIDDALDQLFRLCRSLPYQDP